MLSPNRPSVVILDDYPDAAEAVALLLELEGWRAVWAERIDTAIEKLRCERFDALIMEPHLAAGEASQVAIAARQLPRKMIVISLTASVRQGDETSYEPTLYDFNLVKPVGAEVLIAALRTARPPMLSGTGIAHSAYGADLASSASHLERCGSTPSAAGSNTCRGSGQERPARRKGGDARTP